MEASVDVHLLRRAEALDEMAGATVGPNGSLESEASYFDLPRASYFADPRIHRLSSFYR